MTDLSSVKGGGVVSVQTGVVANTRSGTSANTMEKSYLDVTLPTAVNTDRPIDVRFEGAYCSSTTGSVSSLTAAVTSARLLTSTTVRIGSNYTGENYFIGRWTVTEYA